MNVATYWSHTFLPDLIRADGVVFDFGVNDGGFSRLVAPRCFKVIGFEPDPAWHEPHELPENVLVLPKALAATAGKLPFHLNREKCSSLHYTDATATTVDVPAITLDTQWLDLKFLTPFKTILAHW